MPADRSLSALQQAAARRLALVDPLLPGQPPPEQSFSGPSAEPSDCAASFAVRGPEGEPVAAGHCQHWTGAPGSLEQVWGAATRFTLFPVIAGPDVAGSLDQLIGQWRDHLAAIPEASAEDTAAVINWPSRDIDGLRVMLGHGLTPLSVVAARPFARRGPAPSPDQAQASGATARIRRATPADLDVIAEFALAEIRHDAHFGGLIDRPWTGPAIRQYLADELTDPEPWIWVAEAEAQAQAQAQAQGQPLGLLAAEKPGSAEWIAPLTSRSPVAYLMTAFVPPSVRGSGVGTDLVAEFHATADAAGVGAVLLHYEQFNPRSGPFWSRQGYRPLWTTLEARPARRLR